MNTILVVDDEPNYLIVLSELLKDEGFEVFTAENGKEALNVLNETDLDLIISDMQMPGMNGLDLLKAIKTINNDIPVIMITAFGEIEKAVTAMQTGAYNYLTKPFKNDELIISIRKGIEHYSLVKENYRLRHEVNTSTRYNFGNMIGRNKQMQQIYSLIEKVAPTPSSVLITGESGTGKELVARAIHYHSLRANNSFISLNCAAVPENLLESELFGHEKGAFTGAVSLRKGRFELAHEGTLFLDEIGELELSLQAKLLRILQEKTFERVGGSKSISVDVRILTATNKDLKEEVENGRFREDLYYRLNVLQLHLPPLRERTDDIPLLVNHFIKSFSKQFNKPDLKISSDALQLLTTLQWDGNIRELENTIERASILCTANCIQPEDVCSDMLGKPPAIPAIPSDFDFESIIPSHARLPDILDSIEEKLINNALIKSEFVQTKAAEKLGITKSLLQYKMKKFGIKRKAS